MRDVEILTELLRNFAESKKHSLVDGMLWRASYTKELPRQPWVSFH